MPKLSEAGDITTVGAGITPVPLTGTDRGLPLPSSVTVIDAVRDPDAVGVKVTSTVQLVLAARVDGDSGHVVVFEKSPAFVPVIAMLAIVNAPGPLFVTVILCAPLVVLVV